ncbi:unnamed protein product, partial [Rotaria socialis]
NSCDLNETVFCSLNLFIFFLVYLNELKPVPKLLFLSNYQLYIDATQLDQYRFQGIVDIDAHTAANLLLFCVAYFGIKYPLHKLAMNAIVDFNSVK